MEISKKGLDLIKSFEGLSLKPYLDVVGVPTIGYGTTHYEDGRAVSMNDDPITEERAEELLRYEVNRIVTPAINHYVKVEISQNQFDALASFAYNLGTGALRNSTLLRLLNQWKHDDAAKEFERWNHAGGHVVRGLTRRRMAEKELFLS